MMKRAIVAIVVVAAWAWPVAAAEEEALSPAEQVKVAEAVAPALVRVEYTLRFDKGEAPRGSGWMQRCPSCGRYHGYGGGEEAVREERPLEIGGFLVGSRQVITADMMMHPRFIKSVAVRFGDEVVKAKFVAYARDQSAAFLELQRPLKGAAPLRFDPEREGPYLALTYGRLNATWTTSVKPLPTASAVTETGRRFRAVPSYCLIVDRQGKPVGMSMMDELPVDDSWKGSPLTWPKISAEQMRKMLDRIRQAVRRGVPRVTLRFRSPRKRAPSFMRRSFDEEGGTERNVAGVLVDDRMVMVLVRMPPKLTARLEEITVHPAEGKPVPAKFAHSLRDYGCFLATLERPLPGKLPLCPENVLEARNRLLLSAEVRVQGERQVRFFNHNRIVAYEIGWKRHVYPQVAGDDSNMFFFDTDGRLLALPIVRREKVTVRERWGSDRPVLTAAAYLRPVLADLAANSDPDNVPLTEAEENRLAWMGVELQPLNKELARMNKVSHLTEDGQMGALISYVYPDSPAAKAGIQPGTILLRLHVPGQPKPLDVKLDEFGFGLSGRNFPWDRYDEVPEQYYDRIPRPWPSRENALTRALTDLGFRKTYEAEFFLDGKTFRKSFTIVESPAHYDTAARHESKPLGMTVRDLTYEVRRYFQRAADDPGVIISKVKPGSKASVSGLKPYEIITHVNGKPVKDSQVFARMIRGHEELRLSVKRMTRGRVVRIKLPTTRPAATAPAG